MLSVVNVLNMIQQLPSFFTTWKQVFVRLEGRKVGCQPFLIVRRHAIRDVVRQQRSDSHVLSGDLFPIEK